MRTAAVPDPPVSDHRTPEAAHRDRPTRFGVFLLGEGVSGLGSATSSVLLPLLAVVGLDAGPGWMGLLTAATWLPWLVIGLPVGVWVDRLPARTVMIVADLVSAGAVASVPVAVWCGVLTLPHLLAVGLVVGSAAVFFQAGQVALVPRLVPRGELERANARLFGTESAVQVAGPGVAGGLLAVASAAGGLLLDAVSFVVSAVCLARVRERRPVTPAPATAATPRPHLLARMVQGLTWVSRDRHLRVLMVIGGVSNFGLTGYSTLLVLYLVDDLGVAPGAVGLLLAGCGVGGVLGALVVPPFARRIGAGRASTTLMLVGGPSALLIGLPTTRGQLGLTVAGLVLVATTVVGGNVIRGAWRQRYVPTAAVARVVTASQLVNYGGMPLAALLAGTLGAHLGVRPTVLLMATVHTAACLSVLLTRFGRGRDLPPPSEFSALGKRGTAHTPDLG